MLVVAYNNDISRCSMKNSLITRKEKFDFLKLQWYFILFAYVINFPVITNYITILFFGSSFLLLIQRNRTIKLDKKIVLIVMFSISYFLIRTYYLQASLDSIFTYLISPIVFFLIGSLIDFDRNEFVKFLIFIAFAMFIRGAPSVVIYFINNGLIIHSNYILDFWTGLRTTTTLVATNFTMLVSIFFSVLLKISYKKNRFLYLILTVCIIFSLFFSLIIGNRTVIMIFFIVNIFSVYLFYYLNRKIRNGVSLLIKLLIFILIAYLFFLIDLFSLRTIIESTYFYDKVTDLSIINDPRIKAYFTIIRNFIKYPLGGQRIPIEINYAHNLWLDIYFLTGIIPFTFITVYTIYIYIKIISLIKSTLDLDDKVLVISIFTSILLSFSVEPILEGIPHFFMIFLLMTSTTYNLKRRLKNE